MTENEKLIKSYADAIDCLKKNKPTSGYYMLQESVDMAVNALEEIEQYRAIGTPEECKAAVERNNEKTRIIDGVTECCGYDFGIDAFQRELSKFCPACGRKIERSDEE